MSSGPAAAVQREGKPIGFIGLGKMGEPMAHKLLKAGQALVVYDLREESVATLVAAGAQAAAGPREVADKCEIVILSLLTPQSLAEVAFGTRGLAGGGAIKLVVNTSTMGQRVIEELAQKLAQHGIGLVDSPISGGPPGAREGTLSVMVSGASADLEKVHGLVSQWGRITVAGSRPGVAQILKLTNNILSAVALAATAEAFVMGAKGGLDPEIMTTAVNAGSGRNSMTLDKMPRSVLNRSFDYGGAMHTLMKDIELAIDQGHALGVPMPVCEAARLVFLQAVEAGMDDKDVTEIVRLVERAAGFEMPKTR